MALTQEEKNKINPGLSAVLSFLFSGLGQIYNGQIAKGLFIMACSTIGMILLIVGFVQIGYCIFAQILWARDMLIGAVLIIIGTLLIIVIGAYNIFDAYNESKKKSEG